MRGYLAWAVLGGCGPSIPLGLTDDAPEIDAVDLRRAVPAPPEGGLQLVTPDYVIEPYTEIALCWFSTYVGPTAGVHAQWSFQSQYGHHVALDATNTGAYEHADGDVVECTGEDALQVATLVPLLVGGTGATYGPEGPEGELVLPQGMAVELEQGQRIIVQSHYLNSTDAPILVNDAINLELVDPSEVATWTAPFVHSATALSIGEGPQALEFDCAWQGDVDLLFLAGHMHESGTSFETALTRADTGQTESLYRVADWDPAYREAPPVNEYAKGGMRVHAGDAFTTRCAWDNDSGGVLGFPEEMCLTFGMAYPARQPIVCER